MAPSSKKIDFNLRRDHKKIYYDRHDYESVDEKSLCISMSQKRRKKNNSGLKGLKSGLGLVFLYLLLSFTCGRYFII